LKKHFGNCILDKKYGKRILLKLFPGKSRPIVDVGVEGNNAKVFNFKGKI
jgi:hypothetical protein